MKILQRGFIFILIVLLNINQVLALPSVSKKGLVIQPSVVIDGVAMDQDRFIVDFTNDYQGAEVPNNVITLIDEINSDTTLLDEKISNIDLDEYKMLNEIQDLSVINKSTNTIVPKQKNVTVTWEVPNLIETLKEVRVLHYSTIRNVWEILTPKTIDFKNKTITQDFPDLSPVAILYKENDAVVDDSTNVNKKAKSSKTGDDSPLFEYLLLAMFTLGILLVAYYDFED